jgi:DNA-binding CsgD family transcriptional regulator
MGSSRTKTTSPRIVSPSDLLEAGLLAYRGTPHDEASLVLFLGAEVFPQLGVTGLALVKVNHKARFRVGASFGCLRERVQGIDGVSLYDTSPLASALADGFAEGPLDDFLLLADDDAPQEGTHCVAIRVGGHRPMLAILAARMGPLFFDKHTTALLAFAIENYLADAAPNGPSTPWSEGGDELDNSNLTPRQVTVVDLIGQNKTNKEIGRELSISEALVKHEIRLILKALGVSNRVDATIAAKRLGLID